MRKIRIFNIEWDTDREDVNLPTEIIVHKPTKEMLNAVDVFEYEDAIADYLSDEYGFCVFGFNADFCQ